MTETKKTLSMHGLAIGASVIALLSFLFPFVQITIFEVYSFSGIVFIENAFETEEFQAILSVLCPILCIVGIVCTIMASKQSKAAIGTIVASAAGMIIMYAAMLVDEYGILVYIDHAAWGFYLYEIMSLLAIVLSVPILQMGNSSPVNKEKKEFKIPEIKIPKLSELNIPKLPKITLPKPNIKIPEKRSESAKNVCPKCKKVQEKDAVFCRYCGASLGKSEKVVEEPPVRRDANPKPETPVTPVKSSSKDGKVICPFCGARHAAGTATCKYCGTAIGGSTGSVSAATPKTDPTPVSTVKTASTSKAARKAICPKCGARQSEDVEKCKYCGTPMK